MNESANLRRRNIAASSSASSASPSGDERTPLIAKTIASGWSPAETSTAVTTVGGYATLQWLKDFIANLLQQACRFLWFWTSSPANSESQISQLARDAIQQLRVTIRNDQYDKSNPQHEEALLRLWSVSFPSQPLEARVTKQWGDLGFQGTDPATDFRGGGAFSLRNLLYLADHYPAHYNRMLHSKAGERYPFAITGINITNVLFEILGWGMKPQLTSTTIREKLMTLLVGGPRGVVIQQNAFEELYCAAFVLFDREWTQMRASYMDFPKVLESARRKFENFLTDISSTEDVGVVLGDRTDAPPPQLTNTPSKTDVIQLPQPEQKDLISFE